MHRTTFFLSLVFLLVVPLIIHQVIWLSRSERTTGIYYLEGRGNALDQIKITHSFIYFILQKDTVWFTDRSALPFKVGDEVSILYQKNNPPDAKVDTFLSIWETTVFYGGVPLVILLIIAIQPGVVPYKSKIRLTRNKPFLLIV